MDEEERSGYAGSLEIAERYMSENPGVEIIAAYDNCSRPNVSATR
jgi:hypothetical protein